MPFPIDDLNPIVVKRIMACRDHDPTVKLFRPGHIRHAGRRRHMEEICVRPGSRKARRQRILEHIAASSRIFPNHDLCFMILPVVPSKISSHLKRMFHCQDFIRLSAKTVSSKILSHVCTSKSVDTSVTVLLYSVAP